MIETSSYSVWLYGSHSRGDSDEYSDVDVLVVTDRENRTMTFDLSMYCRRPTFSHYLWKEIEGMAEYGSLFLRHVELEGRPIYESVHDRGRMGRILDAMGPYRRGAQDLKGFRVVLSDVMESLRGGGASNVFEAATLGTVVRHASILGCNLSGVPCFSRFGPVYQLADLHALPRSWADEFPSLYGYRLYAVNRIQSIDEPSDNFVWIWCQRTKVLLDELQRRIDG